MNRCLITQQVPSSLILKFNISQAGVNFCNHLVDNEMFDKAFAIPILSVTPSIKEESIKDKKYTYIQCRFFSHKNIGKVLNAVLENILCAFVARKYKNIWFYNLNKQTVLLFIILRFILFKNVCVIVADFRPDKTFSINSFIQYLIRNCKGIITLSNRSVFKNIKSVCIPGIVPISKTQNNHTNLTEKSFLLSGVLKEATGISIAIDVFSKLSNITLYITGIVEEKYLKRIEKYPNIKYYGYLDFEEYKKLISKIPFGLSLRDPNYAINQNNFPSKILEYFSLNKVVLSTIDYPEIGNFKYFKCRYNVDDISNMVKKINNLSDKDLKLYIDHSENLRKNLSENAWLDAFQLIENKLKK